MIEQKFAHFKTRAGFDAKLTAGEINENGISFIQDEKKIYTHGTYYGLSEEEFSAMMAAFIVDNLVDGGTDKVLSAEQGKVLKGLIDALTERADLNEADVLELQSIVYKNYTTLAIRSSVSIFEVGVKTTPTLTLDTKFDGAAVTPDSLELKKAGTVVSTDASAKTYADTEGITATTTYDLKVVYKGVEKTANVRVSAYYAMYMGSSASESMDEASVLALTKQAIKANANGTYNINVSANTYAWFCIPTEFNINKMTSSGFDVPLEAAATVSVNGHNYKCYRSSNLLAAGAMQVVIS